MSCHADAAEIEDSFELDRPRDSEARRRMVGMHQSELYDLDGPEEDGGMHYAYVFQGVDDREPRLRVVRDEAVWGLDLSLDDVTGLLTLFAATRSGWPAVLAELCDVLAQASEN